MINKLFNLYKQEIINEIKSIEDAFDNNLIPEHLMIKYLVKRDFKIILNDENIPKKEKNIISISNILSDKYNISPPTVRLYYYSKD